MKIFKVTILALLFVVISIKTVHADDFQNGLAAYSKQNYSSAVMYFKNVVNTGGNNAVARYYLAISLVKLNKIDDAKKEYQYIMTAYPNTEAAQKASLGLSLLTNSNSKNKAVIKINNQGSSIVINDVTVNNSIKSTFILDTGATYSSISSSMAKSLGINTSNTSKVKVITANGAIMVPKVIISSIEVGGLIAKNIEVIVHDLGAGNNIAGLLGLSFMDQFKVTLDKANGTLTLEKS